MTGVTVAVTLVDPSGMVTVAGVVTMVLSRADKLMIWPPEPAEGAVTMVTVKVPGEFVARFSGLGVTLIAFTPAVIATESGSLSSCPSLTINCAT